MILTLYSLSSLIFVMVISLFLRRFLFFFFFSSRRRHTICLSDWSSDVCSSDQPRSCGFGLVRAMEEAARELLRADRPERGHPLGAHPGDRVRTARMERTAARPAERMRDRRSEERRVGKERRCARAGDEAEDEVR